MKYRKLGRTDIEVSEICLGTMTWGEQNTEAEGHEQLDYALDQGINFIDTAEMYPVPPIAKTYGHTEKIIGNWLHQRKNRDKIILASKVVGKARDGHIRGGDTHLDRKNIEEAINNSLQRLQTDYLDLYQLHWPDRNTNFFGVLGYQHEVDEQMTPIEETLEVLNDLVKSGKVRHIGLSNETPWGTMSYAKIAEEKGYPRAVSIQNPYNLLNRTFEIGLAEVAHREDIGLLAYSPLAFGVLSGKYLGGKFPEGARLTLFERFQRYIGELTDKCTQKYIDLAKDHDLDPAQMALAYVTSRSFVTSNIIGATTMEQLKSNIQSTEITLSEEVFKEIEKIHLQNSNPCP